MTISDDIREVMANDPVLAGILTGGVYAGIAEISRQDAPGAFDANSEILPCALVKPGTEIKSGPHSHSVQTPVTIYFYQYRLYDAIENAMVRAYSLLHEKKIGSHTWQILYDSSVSNQLDTALECSLSTLRFNAVRSRQ